MKGIKNKQVVKMFYFYRNMAVHTVNILDGGYTLIINTFQIKFLFVIH